MSSRSATAGRSRTCAVNDRFAVTSTGTIEELAAVAPDRAHAKVLVVEQTLELLKDPTVSFSEHAEFAALQPLLSDADHP